MKRIRLLTAAAAAACGMFLSQARAGDPPPAAAPAPIAAPMAVAGGSCCQDNWDPCAKRGLLGNLFKKKSSCCEPACNTCAAPAPACGGCNTGCASACDPCAQRKPGLFSFFKKKSCDSCDSCAPAPVSCCPAPAPACNTCDACDPCAKKSFFKGLFAKKCGDCCDSGCAAPSCGGCAGAAPVTAPAQAAGANPPPAKVTIEGKK